MKNTMKKFCLLFAVMIMAIIFTISASAFGPYESGKYTYYLSGIYDSDGVWTGEYDGAHIEGADKSLSGDVVIPSTLGGYPVKSFSFDTFCNNTNITGITIPQGVKSIDGGSFSGCTNLKNVTIPNSVTYIGDNAFSNCVSLKSINIPSSVTTIKGNAFTNCSSLESITIPGNITHMGTSIFSKCTSLKDVTLQHGLTETATYMFSGCTSLTNISLPSSLININTGTFSGCTNLKDITIPDSVTNINQDAFRYSGLESIDIPNSVTNIGYQAFDECRNLTEVSIGEGVTKIDYAFVHCTNIKRVNIASIKNWLNINFTNGYANPFVYGGADLYINGSRITNLEIPEGITSVDAVKISCLNIESVSIPESLTDIGPVAFGGCNNLKIIKVDDENTSYSSLDGVLFNKDKTTLIFYPKGKEDKSYVMPNTVTRIHFKAFYNNENLKYVGLSDSLKHIDEESFWYCSNLNSLSVIPNSVEEIGAHAFYGNQSLTDVYFNGTEEEWNKISYYEEVDLGEYGKLIYTSFLPNVIVHFNGEIPPIIDPPAPEPEEPDEPDVPDIPTDHEHFYDDDEDETCNTCGYDRTENCDCRCHDDSFFAKIFWKITNFFNKIFKKNKICDCGIAHY